MSCADHCSAHTCHVTGLLQAYSYGCRGALLRLRACVANGCRRALLRLQACERVSTALRHKPEFEFQKRMVPARGKGGGVESAALGGGSLERPRQWRGAQWPRPLPLGVLRRPEPSGAP